MRYLGSKRRLAKKVAGLIGATAYGHDYYIEPFVGGANMMGEIDHPRKIGIDKHKYLVALLKAVRDGWVPPYLISEAVYEQIKQAPEMFPPHLVGFIGFCCSFGGVWFGGYARSRKLENFAQQGSRSLLRQAPKLAGTGFFCDSYDTFKYPRGRICFYCDPPYYGTFGYNKKMVGRFDHGAFFKWCGGMYREGHTVFLSEYNAPPGFAEIYSFDQLMTFNRDDNSSKRTEKLFIYTGL